MPNRKFSKKSAEGTVVTFDFNGEGAVVCGYTKLPTDIRHQLMLHGLKAKVGDSYAAAKSASVAKQAAEILWDQMMEGNWSLKGTGVSVSRYTQLQRAVARVMRDNGQLPSMDKIATALLTKSVQKSVAAQPAVKQALAAVKADDAKARAKAISKVNAGEETNTALFVGMAEEEKSEEDSPEA